MNTWTDIGNLGQARFGHRAISSNDRFYVVGGYNAYLYVLGLLKFYLEIP